MNSTFRSRPRVTQPQSLPKFTFFSNPTLAQEASPCEFTGGVKFSFRKDAFALAIPLMPDIYQLFSKPLGSRFSFKTQRCWGESDFLYSMTELVTLISSPRKLLTEFFDSYSFLYAHCPAWCLVLVILNDWIKGERKANLTYLMPVLLCICEFCPF